MGKAIKKAQEIAAEAEKAEGGEITPKTEENAAEANTDATEAQIQEDTPAEVHAVTLDELEDMDMATFSYQEEPEGPREWKITDDSCADWAVSKIAEERAELERIKALADAKISAIMEKVEAAQKRYDNGTRFLTSKLSEYFETVPHKTTKTQHTYRLLSGTLKMKLGKATMKQDDAKLLEHLKATGRTDMITTTEKPKWGEFKKSLEIVGGSVVDTNTGEIVEAVTVVVNPDTFSVDV